MQNHAQDAKGRGRPPKQRGDKLLTREMLAAGLGEAVNLSLIHISEPTRP